MGKKLSNQEDRIIQRSIGFTLKQIKFFSENPDFKPDVFCRKAIDDQIKLINGPNETATN